MTDRADNYHGDVPNNAVEYTNPYANYHVPEKYLEDQRFANMIAEASKYIGYPYVWCGSDPDTGFDCSGFVSWVLNNCGNGWDFGILDSRQIRAITEEISEQEVRPGDLIFFQGTYEVVGASHVGIVVDPVEKVMIHCGDPLKYACYDTDFWNEHFLCFGRLH